MTKLTLITATILPTQTTYNYRTQVPNYNTHYCALTIQYNEIIRGNRRNIQKSFQCYSRQAYHKMAAQDGRSRWRSNLALCTARYSAVPAFFPCSGKWRRRRIKWSFRRKRRQTAKPGCTTNRTRLMSCLLTPDLGVGSMLWYKPFLISNNQITNLKAHKNLLWLQVIESIRCN